MKSFIALFRGINVGGSGVLSMRDLVETLESIDLKDVKTYIRSGNVAFRCSEEDAEKISVEIGDAVRERFGFAPQVMVLKPEELRRALEANPFPEGESEPKTLHLGFLASAPERPDLKALESLRKESERFALKDRVFYLHAPEGVGRSKLAANIERLLGVPVTSRNWRTVGKVMELVSG
jgi:uncharacterized protein (DUF1697 family)